MSDSCSRRGFTFNPRADSTSVRRTDSQKRGTRKEHLRLSTVIALGIVFFALISSFAAAPLAYAQASKPQPAAGSAKGGGDVARGKYLVESVAMCGECHTPRASNGGVDRTRWLQGASVRWAPAEGGDSNWPLIAPRIGGNPPANDADMIKLLTTGIWTTGKPLRFPMMPFRMSEADAKAVVAYLKAQGSQK
jgi:mono/diheme cytochrome c family protein